MKNSCEHPRCLIALPVYNEPDLSRCLDSLRQQTRQADRIMVCINHPEAFSTDPEQTAIVTQNRESLAELSRLPYLECIDRCSLGQGWVDRKHGVGWARKTLMDTLAEQADDHDLIISVDADTYYPSNYLESVEQRFQENPKALALSNPYYHALSGHADADRAILRYEIYMRLYEAHLRRIRSPYAFTALGSALAVSVGAYRRIGGMSPKSSGEDFYFLQQLSKIGLVIRDNDSVVLPGVRFSDRVFFGTGPAMIKGKNGDWQSYPLYHPTLFDEVGTLSALFQSWYQMPEEKSPNEYTNLFINELIPHSMRLKWRAQSKSVERFTKFCWEKFDGLRHLQYLKRRQQEKGYSDQAGLEASWDTFGLDTSLLIDLQTGDVWELDRLRNALFEYIEGVAAPLNA